MNGDGLWVVTTEGITLVSMYLASLSSFFIRFQPSTNNDCMSLAWCRDTTANKPVLALKEVRAKERRETSKRNR